MIDDEKLTFRGLDGDCELPPPDSALAIWYSAVRDVPTSQMSLFDLGRACRQKLFLEVVVPLCLSAIEEDVLAGDLYDGEIVSSLKHLPDDYWNAHYSEWSRFVPLAARAYELAGEDSL